MEIGLGIATTIAGAVPDPFMAVKKRLRAGHGGDKARARSRIKIDFGERLPIAFPIGVDQRLANVAILSSAWLWPKTV